jgi:4-amino-4-deoxy-L-arabinose transferase-like glycosyltransferase
MLRWGYRIQSFSQLRLWMLSLGWILAIVGITVLWGIGNIGLIDETEPLFVEASRQMLLTGDWITPYFDGIPRFDKPPLIYWLMVLCFKLFGVSEWSARLPSALSTLAIALMSFYTVRRYSNTLNPATPNSANFKRPWLTAWLCASMLLLNLNTYFWGRTGYADMLLTASMGGALLAFFMGYAQPRPKLQSRWYLAFYGLTALAVLTKGPIAILLPAVIIGSFSLYVGNLRQVVRELRLLRGALIVSVLAVPWYALITLTNGKAFINSFFGYHNLERFSSVVNQHSGPWYFHILVLLVGFFPWSAYLPAALFQVKPWQRARWQISARTEQLALFALIWFVVILGFFTISVTKYFSYTLPLMPAAAILVSLLWTPEISASAPRPTRWSLSRWFNVVLLGTVAWASFSCAPWLSRDPWMPTLGADLAAAHLPESGGLVLLSATAAAVLCILLRSRMLWLVNMIAFLLFIIVLLHPAVAIVDQTRQQPLRELAKAAMAVQKPREEILMIGFRKPSLVYYAQQHVTYLERPQQLSTYLSQTNASGQLIITTPKLLSETALKPQQYQKVQQSGVYTLVRLSPWKHSAEIL